MSPRSSSKKKSSKKPSAKTVAHSRPKALASTAKRTKKSSWNENALMLVAACVIVGVFLLLSSRPDRPAPGMQPAPVVFESEPAMEPEPVPPEIGDSYTFSEEPVPSAIPEVTKFTPLEERPDYVVTHIAPREADGKTFYDVFVKNKGVVTDRPSIIQCMVDIKNDGTINVRGIPDEIGGLAHDEEGLFVCGPFDVPTQSLVSVHGCSDYHLDRAAFGQIIEGNEHNNCIHIIYTSPKK